MPNQIMRRRRTNQRMINVIKRLGLTTDLQLCLDAGDLASYDGSSQTWTDASGNGNSFFRGLTSGATATDPTFNGTSGRQSAAEYFSFDGGDGFFQSAAHTFANSWHKDNATFTVAAWIWIVAGAGADAGIPLLRNFAGTSQRGITIHALPLSSYGGTYVGMVNASGSAQNFLPPTQDVITEAAWQFVAVSFSEGSGASFTQCNAFQELFAADTYSSPSASDPSESLCAGGGPDVGSSVFNNLIYPANGNRINSLMAWNRALSQAELLSLYNARKSAFGL